MDRNPLGVESHEVSNYHPSLSRVITGKTMVFAILWPGAVF